MSKTLAIGLSLAVGLAVGIAGGGGYDFAGASADSGRGDLLVQRRARGHWGAGHFRSVRGPGGLAERYRHSAGTREMDIMERLAVWSTSTRLTHKMLKYDLDGHLIYSWGAVGEFPGKLWGVHGISIDQEGNL